MKKRIISLLLAAFMVTPAFTSFAEEAAESTATTAEVQKENKKLSQLNALGIMKDMTLVEFEEDSTIVKKYFYSAIYNIMTDDEETDEKLISFLGNYNIHIEEAEFRDNITREEALGAVVCMLGYSYISPKGDELTDVANQLGIRKYVTGDLTESITLGEVVNLLSGAIEEDMLAISVTTSNGRFGFERIEDYTPLNHYRNIYEVKGYVNKNSHASIVDDKPAPKGYVFIDNESYSAGISNAGDYIGMPVEAYVQYDDDNEGTVLYITPNEKYVTVTKLDAEDILSVDESVKNIEYEIGDKVKTSKLSSVVKVIFNGKNYGDYTSEDLMPDIGSVELIDSDNDRTIDVVNVKNYKTVLVNYVSAYSETVVNKYNDPGSVVLDEEEKEVIIEKNGAAIALADIKPNDILLVAESRSGSDEVVHVLVSDKQELGVINSINESENELYAEGKTYSLSQAYIDAINNEEITIAPYPTLGKNYNLYLDAFGNVAYAVIQDGKIYVYATRLWEDEADGSYGMKMFDTEGTWKTARWAEKIRINGEAPVKKDSSGNVVMRGNQAAYDRLANTDVDEYGLPKFKPQLVRVEYNSDGEIKNIDIAEDVDTPDENKFTRYKMSRDRIYTPDGMTFGQDIYGTADTKVFIVPTDKKQESNYRITSMSYFVLDRWYRLEGYDMSRFYSAPVLLMESDAKTVDNTMYFVNKVYSELVEDEERKVFECFVSGSEVKLITASEFEGAEVKSGDIINIAKNVLGEVTYLEVYKSVAKNVTKAYPSLTDATAVHKSTAFAAGVVTDVGMAESMFLADCGNAAPARFKFLGNTRCYLYDGSKKDKVSVISPSDITPGDNVYVIISWTKASIIYVMRNVPDNV